MTDTLPETTEIPGQAPQSTRISQIDLTEYAILGGADEEALAEGTSSDRMIDGILARNATRRRRVLRIYVVLFITTIIFAALVA